MTKVDALLVTSKLLTEVDVSDDTLEGIAYAFLMAGGRPTLTEWNGLTIESQAAFTRAAARVREAGAHAFVNSLHGVLASLTEEASKEVLGQMMDKVEAKL